MRFVRQPRLPDSTLLRIHQSKRDPPQGCDSYLHPHQSPSSTVLPTTQELWFSLDTCEAHLQATPACPCDCTDAGDSAPFCLPGYQGDAYARAHTPLGMACAAACTSLLSRGTCSFPCSGSPSPTSSQPWFQNVEGDGQVFQKNALPGQHTTAWLSPLQVKSPGFSSLVFSRAFCDPQPATI